MRLALCVVALTVGFFAAPLGAQERPTYDSLWRDATQKLACTSTDYPDFIQVNCTQDYVLWYFTKANHPAHPSVIKRIIVVEKGAISIREEGYSFVPDAARPAFEHWLAQIVALDQKVKDEMTRRNAAGGNSK